MPDKKDRLEIVKIHFGASLYKVDFTLNSLDHSASAREVATSFKTAMAELIPHMIEIKELPKAASDNYRCNSLSLTVKTAEKGDIRKATISCTKITAAGKADNISAPQCLYESYKKEAEVLPKKACLAISEAVRQAKLFIEGHRDLKDFYGEQSELDEQEEAA